MLWPCAEFRVPRRYRELTLIATISPAMLACMIDLNLAAWPRAANKQTIYPDSAGVYALFLHEGATITNVRPGEFGLVYVGLGQGARGLAARCHFKGKTAGHSPRRSLSALLADQLGLRPIFIRKPSGATTFKLDKASEQLLDQWMENSLSVAFQLSDNPDEHERELIRRWVPPLNCDKKICPLNAQQLFVLDRRDKFKAMAAQLASHA
jgi:hypothetical protein